MLPVSTHHHFAKQRSPEGEHRLLGITFGDGDQTDAEGSTNNNDNDTQASYEEYKRRKEQEKKETEAKEEEKKSVGVQAITKRIKQQIEDEAPSAVLDQKTIADLTQRFALQLGDKGVAKLAAKLSGNKSIDELIEEFGGNTISEKLTSAQEASIIENVIRALQQQHREAKLLQSKLVSRVTNRNMFTPGTAEKIHQHAAKLQIRGLSVHDWLTDGTHPPTKQELEALLDDETRALFRNASEQEIKDYLLSTLRLNRVMQNWGTSVLLDPVTRQKLESGELKLDDLQKQLGSDIVKVLPDLNNLLREIVKKECNELEVWTHQAHRDFYREQERAYSQAKNEGAADEAFFAQNKVYLSHATAALDDAYGCLADAKQTVASSGNDFGFFQQASTLIERMHERMYSDTGESTSIFESCQAEQKVVVDWGEEMLPTVESVLSLPREKLQQVATLTGHRVEDVVESLTSLRNDITVRGLEPSVYNARQRRKVELMLLALSQPTLMDGVATARSPEQPEAEPDIQTFENAIEARVNETRTRLQDVVEHLLRIPLLHQGPSQKMGIPLQIRLRAMTLDKYLLDRERSDLSLTQIEGEIDKLDQVAKYIEAVSNQDRSIVHILSQEEYVKAVDGSTHAYFDQSDGQLYINKDACGDKFDAILAEEQYHAIVDRLVRGPFPYLMKARYQQLKLRADENVNVDKILQDNANRLHVNYEDIEAQKEEQVRQEREEHGEEWRDGDLTQEEQDRVQELTDLEYGERLTEEAYIWSLRRLDEIDSGQLDRQTMSNEDKQLLGLFERAITRNDFAVENDVDPLQTPVELADQRVKLRMFAPEDEAATAVLGEEGEGGGGGEEADTQLTKGPRQKLYQIEQNIFHMEQFVHANPSYAGELPGMIEDFKGKYSLLNTVFTTGRLPDGTEVDDPENNPAFRNEIDRVLGETKVVMKLIHEKDEELRDVSYERPTTRNALKAYFWDNIAFLSALDIYYMVKDGIDDVVRMWQRKSTKNRSAVGARLFGIIPENPIPGLAYLGRLKHDYARRSEEKENEEVDVWRDALKTKDAFELQDMIENVKHVDQLKAVMYLLADKGRIDWDDKRLWRTLSKLSIYKMPEARCERDSLTRDAWLRKIISQIWDKDLYFEWRQSNDGAISSGKDKFTSLADDLSNVSEGLAGRLEMQLKLYYGSKKATPPQPVPESVNPHLYEEILHYAMRNGKMSMEQKVYYLVRGVHSGLLSLDRLRFLAGEGGGILNQFPFIDYFYGHNNTRADIDRIATRITENPPNQYQPGSKTSLWLHLEVLRDENARQRISKAISGLRAEKLDHEDIPAIMSQADLGSIDELTGVISGDRLKLSPEAMKNAYVGFSSRLKLLARTAELDGEDGIQYSSLENAELARTILSYVHYDNTITGNGWDGRKRARLEWDAIKNTQGPSTGGRTVHEIRKGNNKVVKELFDALEALPDVSFNWGTGDGQIGATKEEYLRMMTGEDVIDDKTYQDRIFKATRRLMPEFTAALQRHPEVAQAILQNNADTIIPEHDVDITKEDARLYYRERASQRNGS